MRSRGRRGPSVSAGTGRCTLRPRRRHGRSSSTGSRRKSRSVSPRFWDPLRPRSSASGWALFRSLGRSLGLVPRSRVRRFRHHRRRRRRQCLLRPPSRIPSFVSLSQELPGRACRGPAPAAISGRLVRARKMAICRAFLMAEAAYTAKDITVLEGLEPVRLRPGMYIGSTGSRGLHHLVYEVVDNAVDEALAGRNDLVDVTIHPDNSVTVVDAGAGIPVDVIPEQGLPALTVVLTKLHACGKFGGECYKVSGGLHGVGVSVVNALSEWLVAEVRRDGKVYRQEFARGEPTGDMEAVGVAPKKESGTTISFLPDPEVFDETEFSAPTLSQRIRETAFLTRGL